MFNESKYTHWYFSIVKSAATSDRKKSDDQYYENHHIVPKSLGGNNAKSNLVLLTAREHFLCHWLLTKMVDSIHFYKMACAFNRMLNSSKKHERNFNSKQYEVARKVFAESMRGPANPRYGKAVFDHRGRKRSEKTKQRISAARAGSKASEETRAKMSQAKTGKGKKTYQFIDPKGNLVTVTNMKQFCAQNKFDVSAMYNLANGKYCSKTYKGWAILHS
ncbi:MobE homing endonuclease [Sinorhizobium phage phiN3]|uniref:MobE homing endonuclease n=1 Tax=Sinorhizobium phage phiN3 TaxID=1647405 RepID=A0A0F6WD21_9CAUD|nr:homing endonuclease [Sinorhizobium phage phiN3]AKF13580.1 MobE homing endonuclease [Sinorhizobium phage phiN3]